LLSFATINVILLLPSYHRFDDATVLVFVLGACLLTYETKALRWASLIAVLIFALPVPAALVSLAEQNRISRALLSERSFQLTCLTFQVWFLLLLAIYLLLELRKSSLQTADGNSSRSESLRRVPVS